MQFPLGRPILVMLVVAIGTGGAVLSRPGRPPGADSITLWTFAESHADSYRALLPTFEARHARRVDVELIPVAALNLRMMSLLIAGISDGLPDAVELELNTVGQYFRPPASAIGLLPLNHYLQTTGYREIPSLASPGQSGLTARCRADGKIYTFRDDRWRLNSGRARPDAWIDRIPSARLALWTKDGQIFGIPHDLHPVTLTYRDDLYRAAGIDLSTAKTWAQFHDMGLKFQAYWRHHADPQHPRGYINRWAMEAFNASPDELVCLLLQRHINLIDADGVLHLSDPKTIQTIAFYVRLIAGPDKIGSDSSMGTGPWVNDLANGNICATLTPDWRSHYIRQFAPASLRGKLRMMPLPRFDPDDAPTSTWSGTMIGIPRAAPNPDLSWELIERLYFSHAGLEARVKEAGILPPVRDFWTDPILHQPDAVFEGQKTFELYISLAEQTPRRQMSWATPVATQALGYVMVSAASYLRAGHPPQGLESYILAQMRLPEWVVQRYLQHGQFNPPTDAPGQTP